MSAKTHIVDSAEPMVKKLLTLACQTRCGILVIDPRPVFMWDLQEMGAEMNVSGCCRKCLKVEDPRSRYSYGVKV